MHSCRIITLSTQKIQESCTSPLSPVGVPKECSWGVGNVTGPARSWRGCRLGHLGQPSGTRRHPQVVGGSSRRAHPMGGSAEHRDALSRHGFFNWNNRPLELASVHPKAPEDTPVKTPYPTVQREMVFTLTQSAPTTDARSLRRFLRLMARDETAAAPSSLRGWVVLGAGPYGSYGQPSAAARGYQSMARRLRNNKCKDGYRQFCCECGRYACTTGFPIYSSYEVFCSKLCEEQHYSLRSWARLLTRLLSNLTVTFGPFCAAGLCFKVLGFTAQGTVVAFVAFVGSIFLLSTLGDRLRQRQ
jgi:hypothetical protein